MNGLDTLSKGDTMFSGEGIMPWQGLGVTIDGMATAAEALAYAKLDWQVEKRQMSFVGGNGQSIIYPDRFATVRVTDDHELGIVSAGYHVFQNKESFEFFDAVTDAGTGEAHYTAAGQISGGQRVFLTAKIGNGFKVAGEDAHDLYLLITNSHDGTKAFDCGITAIRVRCKNTVTLALKSAKTRWTLRHKSDLKGKVQEARDSLKMTFNYQEAFEKEIEKLLAVKINKDQMLSIAEAIVPQSKFQHGKAVNGIMDTFENEPTVVDAGIDGTGWAAFNAITYWADWERNYQTEDSRFKSLVGKGFAETLRDKAHKKILSFG